MSVREPYIIIDDDDDCDEIQIIGSSVCLSAQPHCGLSPTSAAPTQQAHDKNIEGQNHRPPQLELSSSAPTKQAHDENINTDGKNPHGVFVLLLIIVILIFSLSPYTPINT